MLIEYDADIVEEQHSQNVTSDQFVYYILQKAFVKDETICDIEDITIVDNNKLRNSSHNHINETELTGGVAELTYVDRRGTELTEELSYKICVVKEENEYVYDSLEVSYY